MVEWPPDWIWRMFNRETAYVNDFIKSVIDVRKETLRIIENNSADGGQDDALLTEEISKFISISEKLLKKRNYTLAYFFTLIAERRILIYLIKNKERFPSIIESRRLDYISDAKKLEREGKLEEEEIENLKEISGKKSLGKADWFILSVFIVRARSEMVADQIQRATEADRLLRKLAFFSTSTSVLLLFIHLLTLFGLVVIFPVEAEIQTLLGNATIEFLESVPFITPESFNQSLTLFFTMIFGVAGALVFGILTQRKSLTDRRDLPVISWWFDFSRLVLGAISAPIVVIFVYSGFFQIVPVTPTGLFALSFISGYSEVLLDKVVEQSMSSVDERIETSRHSRLAEGSPENVDNN